MGCAGAVTAGACVLCAAGTYQTGSGPSWQQGSHGSEAAMILVWLQLSPSGTSRDEWVSLCGPGQRIKHGRVSRVLNALPTGIEHD